MVKKIVIAVFSLFVLVSVGYTVYAKMSDKNSMKQTAATTSHKNADAAKQSNNYEAQAPKEDKNAVAHSIGVDIGNTSPDFKLATLDGKEVSLSSYRGKKVILNFWATWCPPCRQEMPDMEAFYEQHAADQNVVVLAVNLTIAESSTKNVENFIKEHKLTFPVLLAQSEDIANTFQTFTIPTSYIIDSKGIIRNKMIGPMSQDWMKTQIEAIQ
ncbi:MAG: TlpA family protein disulfide reductase [Tuberibacillus sp.]